MITSASPKLSGRHLFRWLLVLVLLVAGSGASAGPSPSAAASMALGAAAAAPTVIAGRDDAFITSEGQDSGWTLGNDSIAYAIGFDESGRLTARDLRTGAGGSFHPARQVDTVFEVEGRPLALNRSEVGGFTLTRVESGESAAGLELRLTFSDGRDGLTATRVYAVYPGIPIIETWIVFEATTTRTVALSELGTLQLVVDGSNLTWVRGLYAAAESGGSFTIERRAMARGDEMALESAGRSTQTALPHFALGAEQGTFFGGYLWSGSWRIDLIGQPNRRLEATIGLGDTRTAAIPGDPVELPHAIFGVVPGGVDQVAAAFNRFIVGTLREGRAFNPLVTYNGWFITGTAIDRDTIELQMEAAAAQGTEVFELDAGWYEGAGERDVFDFSSGLGSWRVDAKKFPEGLRPLGDLARSLGMKFGLWVEPERVDLRLLGQPGMAREEWLAQENGLYEPGVPNDRARTAMLDLGVPEAREWILGRLTTLIEEQGVDYLKWDSNFWINNTRARSGRGAYDGNFRHVRGLYAVLAELKARFPNLVIENCSGGGNRLDFGMMRYTDVGWMDDRTAPSSHVRHNLEGLTTFLPPAYLLSYLIGHADEPMHRAPDIKLYARSRMPGVFGLSLNIDELDEGDTRAVREATDVWKGYRAFSRSANAVLLTDQAGGPAAPGWDALALVSPARDMALLYAFENDHEVESATVVLRGLDPESVYEIRSLENGTMGLATGADLMTTGIKLLASPESCAHLLQLTRAVSPAATDGAISRVSRTGPGD